VDGVDAMRALRPAARRDRDLLSGPAKLCQAYGITGAHDGADLVKADLEVVLADDGTPPPTDPGVGPRIGLAMGKGDAHPWRWWVSDDPNVSR
jgi:DNA-3-methyladenine glycosylase